jgi:hypothetical protein
MFICRIATWILAQAAIHIYTSKEISSEQAPEWEGREQARPRYKLIPEIATGPAQRRTAWAD